MLEFLRAHLGWSIEIYVLKLSNIKIYFYLSQQYCVQKYLGCISPKQSPLPITKGKKEAHDI
jgi:hypothetical protein